MYNIKIVRGNIVNANVEAIVTPANNNLMPGHGISKMVFYSAGKKLIEACAKLKHCDTGNTVVTSAYNLPAKYIIHAVGPFWHGGYVGEAKNLASVYVSIMRDVRKLKIKSVAIPALCTGHGHYPAEEATDIALSSIISYVKSHNMDTEIWFMCADSDAMFNYRTRYNDGIGDISKYFDRSDININAKLNDTEKKLLKKKLFKKTIEPEKEKEAMISVLKRQIKKKYPNCTLLLSRTNDKITIKTVEKYNKSGPFITADSIKEMSYDDERMKIHIVPFCFTDTEEEAEANKVYDVDLDMDGIPDEFANGVSPSYNKKKELNVTNVESILNANGTSVKADDDANISDEIRKLLSIKLNNDATNINLFFNNAQLTNEQVDYLYEISHKNTKDETEYVSKGEVQDTEYDIAENDIANDDNIGIPFEEYIDKNGKKMCITRKYRNKSKYRPNYKPDYRSREYQKKLHAKK